MNGLQRRGITRLGYVRIALALDSLEQVRTFYTDVLGLVEDPAPVASTLLFRCWHEAMPFSLVIERRAVSALTEIGFELAAPGDCERLAGKLQKRGLSVLFAAPDEALRGIGASVACDLPGALRLRLYAGSTREPAYLVGHAAPDWVVPRGLRATPAPIGLNHVGVTVPDPAETARVLCDALDFVVSERIEAQHGRVISALLFCSLKDVGGQDLALFEGRPGGLHHIAFTKEDSTDILLDAQYLRSARVRLDPMGPTRQSYGRTFSLHFHDPAGVRLELCSGGRACEPHPEFVPVVWDEAQLDKALSFYDQQVSRDFLAACL